LLRIEVTHPFGVNAQNMSKEGVWPFKTNDIGLVINGAISLSISTFIGEQEKFGHPNQTLHITSNGDGEPIVIDWGGPFGMQRHYGSAGITEEAMIAMNKEADKGNRLLKVGDLFVFMSQLLAAAQCKRCAYVGYCAEMGCQCLTMISAQQSKVFEYRFGYIDGAVRSSARQIPASSTPRRTTNAAPNSDCTCFSKETYQCKMCHSDRKNPKLHQLMTESYLCIEHFFSVYVACNGCGKVCVRDQITADDSQLTTAPLTERRIRKGKWCHGCYEFVMCATCNREEAIGYLVNGSCRRCVGVAIHEYNFKPDPVFLSLKDQSHNPALFAGIELEVEMKPEFTGVMEVIARRAAADLSGTAYFKKDSSLACGMELVSHPGTYEWWMEKDNRILKCIRKLSVTCESFWPETTGMHVHLSRAGFSTSQLAYFIKFIHDNRRFVAYVAERHNETYAFYDEHLAQYPYTSASEGYQSDHHAALSTYPHSTIELRVFKGNMRITRVLKNIQFCYALAEFAGIPPVVNADAKMKDLSPKDFIAFVEMHKDKYPDLHQFISKYRGS
jgi:hypothetical protein